MARTASTIALTTLGVLAVEVVALVVIAETGAVNVAASQEHLPGVRWFLDTLQHSSVEDRAEGISPEGLDDPARVEAGLRHYHETCVMCHGAPGVDPAEFARGLRPSPPELWEEDLPPAQDFWILKHGIRMTAMPAFGRTHPDEELWDMVAFLEVLPTLDAAEYARMVRQAGMELAATGHEHGGEQQAGPPEGGGHQEGGGHGAEGHHEDRTAATEPDEP